MNPQIAGAVAGAVATHANKAVDAALSVQQGTGLPMQYALWAGFLLLQNASFTFVSRARNSASYTLHAVAAMCSNGVWFAAQFVSLGIIIELIKNGTWTQRIGAGAFYTFFTVTGSVGMHWFGKRFIEKGNRKVGA